jgi:hypothetical protein
VSITHVTVRQLYAAPGGLRARFYTRFVEQAGERDTTADHLAHVLHATPTAALNGSLLLSEGRVTTVWVQSVEALVAPPGAPVGDRGEQTLGVEPSQPGRSQPVYSQSTREPTTRQTSI